MKNITSLLCLFCIVILTSSATADVWIPPWGEAVYDSIHIDINVRENQTVLEVTTMTGVRKLVSDDYLLHFARGSMIGNLHEESAEANVSDQLTSFEADGDLIELTYLSTLAQEEELSLSVYSRYVYNHDNPQEALNQFIFSQVFQRTSDDSAWWWADCTPVYEDAGVQVAVKSNIEITAWTWNSVNDSWGRPVSGEGFSADGEMYYSWYRDSEWLGYQMKIVLDNEGATADSLFEDVLYELTPEIRLRTPDLILEEDVRITLSKYPDYPETDNYDYYMVADISLNPNLALDLAPMWLWFPNDQTVSPEVQLKGYFAKGAWGHFPEEYREQSLEVRQGRVNDQDGFYIKIPTLEVKFQDPNNIWFWSDPNLHVEVCQDVNCNSARFILITAPLEPSRIRFTIPDWKYFNTWENPLEEVSIERQRIGNVLTFSGNCPEPGIAGVTWSSESAPEQEPDLPERFELTGIYPNPFNSTTTISYTLPQQSDVSLSVYDPLGQRVATLLNGNENAGYHSVNLNANDLPSGLYLVRLTASGYVFTEKVMLIK
ncbi:T9SS type A sorting domain-containing protein [bacterium]|nr:T9SS type A sorting domain-containing protein [bacterium]